MYCINIKTWEINEKGQVTQKIKNISWRKQQQHTVDCDN
jgi:hypothetical protein